MFNLIRKLLDGFTNMTSIKSEEKEVKMLTFKTNIPTLDAENTNLFRASEILERMGNDPGMTADEFYRQLALSEFSAEDFQAVTMAAIAIETMMNVDATHATHIDDLYKEPTIH